TGGGPSHHPRETLPPVDVLGGVQADARPPRGFLPRAANGAGVQVPVLAGDLLGFHALRGGGRVVDRVVVPRPRRGVAETAGFGRGPLRRAWCRRPTLVQGGHGPR